MATQPSTDNKQTTEALSRNSSDQANSVHRVDLAGENSAEPNSTEQTAGRHAEPTKAEIAAAINQLGDDVYDTRERASDFLWRAGATAIPALEAAKHSYDHEVVFRANEILEKLRFGITPDMPPEIAGLIASYRMGNADAKQFVLRQLVERRYFSILARLVKSDPDPAQRQLARGALYEMRRGVDVELQAHHFDAAQELLELIVDIDHDDFALNDYGCFLLLQGKLNKKIDELQSAATGQTDPQQAKMLARFLQMAGRLEQAIDVAKQAGDKALQTDFAIRRQNWKLLATPEFLPSGAQIETLGYKAAFNRLAGNQAACDAATAELVAIAKSDRAAKYSCVKALLINDCWSQSIDLLQSDMPNIAFELQWTRQNIPDAFHRLGIKNPHTDTATWFKDRCLQLNLLPIKPKSTVTPPSPNPRQRGLPAVADSDEQRGNEHFQLGLRIALLLSKLGETEQFEQLHSTLAELAAVDDAKSAALLAIEMQAGWKDRARARAKTLLDRNVQVEQVIRCFAPEKPSITSVWWRCFRQISPEKSSLETLDDTLEFLPPGLRSEVIPTEGDDEETAGAQATPDALQADDRASATDPTESGSTNNPLNRRQSLVELLQKVDLICQQQPLESRKSWYHALAEGCMFKGHADLGRKYFELEATAAREQLMQNRPPQSGNTIDETGNDDGSQPALIRIGDIWMTERKFTEAAAAYERAWKVNRANPLALYLQGVALEQAGKKDDGLKLKQWASLLPLAGGAARRTLAEGLDFRGLKNAGIWQWELLERVAALQHWNDFNQAKASEILGRAKRAANPRAAAVHLQNFWLFLLQTNVSLTNNADFIHIESTIHGLRALKLLDESRFDEAVAEVNLAQAAYAGDITLDELAVAKLTAAGRNQEAEKIFTTSRDSMEGVLSEFPNSALYHNNLAWLFARCDRQLDDALPHAIKATTLAPTMAGYVDTLAEIHFRKGDKQTAVELELQALEKEPHSPELRRQLARFEEE